MNIISVLTVNTNGLMANISLSHITLKNHYKYQFWFVIILANVYGKYVSRIYMNGKF